MLCFSILFSGYGEGPFIVPVVTNLLPFFPLIAFVWSGHTYRPPSLCDIHPCQTEAGLFRSSVYHNTSFLPQYKCFLSLLSRHAPNGSPSNLPLLGSLSSQQDEPPKKAWAGAIKQIFSPLPNTKPYPPYLLPLAHGSTTSYIGWIQAGGAWALRMLPFQICPRVCLLLMRLP